MKDGHTHLAHKAEHAVDMQTGAVLAVTLQEADQGDTTTVLETLSEAGETVAELIGTEEANQKPQMHVQGIAEVVADKGYHSSETLMTLSTRKCGRTFRRKNKRASGLGKASMSNNKRCMRTGGE